MNDKREKQTNKSITEDLNPQKHSILYCLKISIRKAGNNLQEIMSY